jgi:hypothetical protein
MSAIERKTSSGGSIADEKGIVEEHALPVADFDVSLCALVRTSSHSRFTSGPQRWRRRRRS